MQRQQPADDSRNEKKSAGKIQLREQIPPPVHSPDRLGRFEKEHNEQRRDEPKRQVDIETPPPRGMIRQRTTHQRARDTRNPKHRPEHARVDRPSSQRHRLRDDENGPREQPSTADTSHGATHDQPDGVGSDAADERAEFEDEQGSQVDPFDREERVQLAEHQGQGAARQQIPATIPTHIVDGVELTRDFRDRRGYNRIVLLHLG